MIIGCVSTQSQKHVFQVGFTIRDFHLPHPEKNIGLLQGLNPSSEAICSKRLEASTLTTETFNLMSKIISGRLVY